MLRDSNVGGVAGVLPFLGVLQWLWSRNTHCCAVVSVLWWHSADIIQSAVSMIPEDLSCD